MAIELHQEIARSQLTAAHGIQCRIGMHSGPAVAGVIGAKKFIYDVWGDTVNTANRMEALGVPGAIHVTEEVYQRLREGYRLELRGVIDVKGKGPMKTYFLTGRAS
jgi:class 3 adenylate cyclase